MGTINRHTNYVMYKQYIFQEKKRGYLKGVLNVLETNSKKKNIRVLYIGTNAFREALKEGKVDGLTKPHIILSRWKNHLSLINVQGVDIARRTELQYVELSLVPSRKRTTWKTSA